MSNKLVIDTKTQKSLFKPIEVEVNDKMYSLNELTVETLEIMNEYEKLVQKGDLSAASKQLPLLFDIPLDEVRKMDIRLVSKILNHLLECIFRAEEKEETVEKKNDS